jgi:hypothetical protein
VLLWYVGLSILLVHVVFRSSGVDYRLVALGALLPLLVDAPLRRQAYGHTVLASAALLAVVMLATVGRSRLLRRRLLCLPIGALCGLVLSGVWAEPDVFWWPVGGASFPRTALLPPVPVVALEELAGAAACVWLLVRLRLSEPGRLARFVRSGRADGTVRR